MMRRYPTKAPIKITPAYGFSYISQRALREGLGRREFGPTEMERVIRWFSEVASESEDDPRCVYCGDPNPRRWDHLISIRDNGETVLGNMVLACQPCDDSKGRRSFREWMLGSSPKSPLGRGKQNVDERVRRLDAYMRAFEYHPIPLEKRLDIAERAMLVKIRTELERIRSDVHTLIDRYQERTTST